MNESKYDFKYRLDLDFYQFKDLQNYMLELEKVYEKNYNLFKDDDILKEDCKNDLISLKQIKEIVDNPKKIKHSTKKIIACDKATEARTAKAKKKIQNAINILRMENKKLTHYSIAKTAKVSYLTVKKYISLDDIR